MWPIALAIAGAALVFGGVLYFVSVATRPPQKEERRLTTMLGRDETGALRLDARSDSSPFLTRLLSRVQVQRRLQLAIIRAGLLVRPSELVVISLGVDTVGIAGGYILAGPLGAVLGGILFSLAPWIYLSMKQEKRKRALMLQLGDTLDLICASLKAGHGFSQALKTVATQLPPPMGDDAARVIEELGLGIPLEKALDRMIERTGQPDVELMCTAVQIQVRTGGNLAEVLSALANVIRERVRLAGEVVAITAEGRTSAAVLLAIPFVMAAALHWWVAPGWLTPLFVNSGGKMILAGALCMMVLGALIIRRMIRLDI